MKNQRLAGILILLLLSMANFNRQAGNENIKAVQFLSIFAIGILAGLLLSELRLMLRNKKDNSSKPA
jgi:hypothetical protein